MSIKIWLAVIVLVAAGGVVLMPMAALAQGVQQQGFLAPDKAPIGTAQGTLGSALYVIINVFLALVGVAAAVFLIISGFRYIASRGNEQETTAAKNGILFAVIGLIVIGLSAAIVRFVIGAINQT